MAPDNNAQPGDTNFPSLAEPRSRELANQVGETRSAITSDIRELGEKLGPSQLKEEAKKAGKEFATGAKDVVVEKAVEVKDAIVEKTAEVADAAAEKLGEAKQVVSEAIDDAGETAARIGRATWRFTAANAAPLALVGIGAGWMISNSRRSEPQSRSAAPARGAVLSRRPNDGRYMSWQTLDETDDARAARNPWVRAKDASVAFADANPLTLAITTLALGVGVGLLLPATDREDKLLAPTRQKFDHLMGEAREIASDVVDVAKETASESLSRG